MLRPVLKAFAVALVAATALVGGAYVYARRSLPVLDGSIVVAGISAPIEIVRDAAAVPHIFATTKRDGLFGLGYVHAQDRLWQMEFQRRVGFGRLSEIVGPATIPQDRFLRTVGFGRAARSAWDRLPAATRDDVTAYVAGVNAFLATHHGGMLPPEFSLFRFEPEPWGGADVIVWQKMMAWDLSMNYSFELLRHDILARVGSARLAALMPPYAREGLSILNESVTAPPAPQPKSAAVQATDASWSSAFMAALSAGPPAVRDILTAGAVTEALGSNGWVVDGTLTASGKPLLANDPHLNARLPSIWYLAHISAGDYDVIGASIPGTPAIVLGRNRSIAWGATNLGADVEDLYQERLDPTGRFAEFRGAREPLQILRESIAVKGRPAVSLDVRVSRHGPLVSDAINANNAEAPTRPAARPLEPLALRWTALDADDTTIAAIMKLGEARNWTDFTAALAGFLVPAQSFLYADVDGHIGYYAAGRIPIRAAGDGATPSEGWTGDREWTSWIPFADLPHVQDPADHLIVTANHRPAPESYRYLLGLEWPEPYRAQRIAELLRSKDRLTPDDFARFQADTVSLHARTLLPLLLDHARPEDVRDRQAVSILRQWSDDARDDSAAAAIFEAWFLRLAPAFVGDELGRVTTVNYAGRFSFVTRFLLDTLSNTAASTCADTRGRPTCDGIVTKALHDAIGDLTRRLGSDLTRWRWDAVHPALFPHQGLDSVAVLGSLLSRRVPSAGDWSTVRVGAVAHEHPYEQHAIASYRDIIDLSPANDSRFADAIGESGHPLSPHYDDFLNDWRAVRHRRMEMDRPSVEREAIGRLRLEPLTSRLKSQRSGLDSWAVWRRAPI
jgi:penicillin amidase